MFQLKAAVGVEAIRDAGAVVHPAGARGAGRRTRPSRSWAATRRTGCRSSRSSSATTGRYLHHNFVVALLNDLFGIQSRGGCSCAGPYGHRLLGIDLETSHEFEREIARGCEGIKPGWVRVNFNYFISEAVFEYILDAVDLVASDGWRLLAATTRSSRRPGCGRTRPAVGSRPLACATSPTTAAAWPGRRTATGSPSRGWPTTSSRRGRSSTGRAVMPATPTIDGDAVGPDFEALRWFLLPEDVAAHA